MDAGDWITMGVSATLAAVAIAVSLRALRYSRRSADAGERSAGAAEKSAEISETAVAEARRSAAAAEAQALAATQQVEILLAQMADQRAEQDRPRFAVVAADKFLGDSTVPIDVTMTAGADLRSLAITVTGKDVRGVAGAPTSLIRGGQTISRDDFTIGARTTVWADIREVLSTTVSVQIDGEAPDGRKWTLPPAEILLTHPALRNQQR